MNQSIARMLSTAGAGALLFAACGHQQAAAPAPVAQPAPAAPAPAPVAAPPAPTPAPVAEAKPAEAPAPAKESDYKTPESILWDSAADVYLVSNINGTPNDLDKNGFIAKVGHDGKIIDAKWIDGSKKGVDLSAPKGMAIVGDVLYVSDVDTVRKFDRKTGKPKGAIAIKGAVFLNDLSASPDGKTLYVSDSGVKFGEKGPAPTGDDAVYAIDVKKGTSKVLIKDKDLHGPNGLCADANGVWVVTLLANELFHVSAKGEKGPATSLPNGGLDGLVKLPDGSLLVSSWGAQAVYRGLPGGAFTELFTGLPSPADIGLDGKRQALLIPNFMGNAIDIRPLPALPPIAPPPPPSAKAPAPAPAPAATAPAAAPAPAAPATK